ncbi:MAG: VTT domain-containing protein [Sandaracinaceae bacterium]|nr:VTT domain-containing protein [Sandaracinaceae bacterium]
MCYPRAVETVSYLLGLLRDPGPIIEWGGYPALALIVFLETGALVAFLPGDSLLVVAGLYARDGALSLLLLNAILIPCAVLGDATSYMIGQKTGPLIFKASDPPRREAMSFLAYWPRWMWWKLRNPESLMQAKAFYEKHGGKAIIIARFMPIVRTFVPVVAGVAQMPYRRFASYNVIGGLSWVLSMTVIGYFLGSFDVVRHHLEKVIILVVFLSILPAIIGWWRGRKEKAAASA